MPRRTVTAFASLAACAALLAAGTGPGLRAARAGDPPAGGYGYAATLGAELDASVGASVQKGRWFLTGKRDVARGTWGPKGPNAGYTALVTLALIGSTPRESVAKDPFVTKALDFLKSSQKENGAIWTVDQVVNYETSAAVAALAAAKIADYRDVQTKARDYLEKSQLQGEESSPRFGGFPYREGNQEKPTDLSNTQFASDALHAADLPADSPVWKRLVTYLGKVQNVSETNTFVLKQPDGKEVVSGNDGGGIYAPGTSKVGTVARPDGKLEAKSYGSMTYALLKCLLFAGVKADDARVKRAIEWLSKNFTVERNPGFEALPDAAKMGQQGYYYYLLTMARALAEYEKATGGKPFTVTDVEGKQHAWRREIAARLVSLQKPDGSWVNDVAERWDEGSPVLATAYALQTLATCQGRYP
jgi:squalene-hopene/tetraprenyl-beta-curcumene cyclase